MQIMNILLLSFQYFSCLIALVENANTVLSRNGENGHPCPFPVGRGKCLIFHHLSVICSCLKEKIFLIYQVFI